MTRHDLSRRSSATVLACAMIALVAFLVRPSCAEPEREQLARAQRITSASQLIGGPAARGEIGDYLMENDHIRVIIQDLNYNRGSGLFGGSLIDADLVRLGSQSDLLGGNGRDSFGEMFPAYFLEVIDPETITVVSDGQQGGPAIIEVSGRGGEFVTMLRLFNQVMVNSYDPSENLPRLLVDGKPARLDQEPQIELRVRYILEPDARHVKVVASLTNITDKTLEFPNTAIINALGSALGLDLGDFTVPTGHVLGLGKRNTPFLPGIGYDLQFGLQDAYARGVDLPGLPGHVTPLVATSSGDGISYGFVIDSMGREDLSAEEVALKEHFIYAKDQQLNASGEPYYGGDASPEDMLFLFYASGFGGVFTHQLPATLAPGACEEASDPTTCAERVKNGEHTFSFTSYLIIGDGDVSSIYDEVWGIRDVETSEISGRVLDAQTGQPAGAGETILVYAAGDAGACTQESAPTLLNQVSSQERGTFRFRLPQGSYCYRTQAQGRPVSDFVPFSVNGIAPLTIEPIVNPRGIIEVVARDEAGAPLPARVTVVGTHAFVEGATSPRDFLFELRTGEHWRITDMTPDDPNDPSTRRFIEQVTYTNAQGFAQSFVRPNHAQTSATEEGEYLVYVSRGPEYDVDVHRVKVAPGQRVQIGARLVRSVETPGYLSGDFHLHARGSIDSGLAYDRRVLSLAGEGVEVAVSTDHNYISDYAPYIRSGELQPFITSVVGLELTTFEAGHFNAFPLEYDVESANRGSFQWQDQPPGLIFEELRQRGSLSPAETIVQVNHPRDAILGYFEQHNVDPITSTVTLPFREPGATITDTIAVPTSPAFYTEIDGVFESTFSWNFDAIEIFNGKRMELLRHFRTNAQTLRPVFFDTFAADELDMVSLDIEGCATARTTLETRCDDPTVQMCVDAQNDVDTCIVAEAQAEVRTDAYIAALGDGEVIVCDDGEVAFSGHLDDWYNTLNMPRPYGVRPYEEEAIKDASRLEEYRQLYKRYTATGNSDSHSAEFDDPGYPRNYFWTGHDDPQALTPKQLSDAVKQHRVIVTNGPFASMTIGEATVGQQVDASGPSVSAQITVGTPNWMRVDRWRVIGNGEVVASGDVTMEDEARMWTTTIDLPLERDTWFVLEVEGDQSMFPVIAPAEIPPFDLDSAIGSLAGPFGFGAGPEGLEPDLTFQLTPFAFTNPIWVVADGDATFDPPGIQIGRCLDPLAAPSPSAVLSSEVLKGFGTRRLDGLEMPVEVGHDKPVTSRLKGEVRDVRLIFEAWGHSH